MTHKSLSMYLFLFLTLYMFRARRAHHRERQIVSIQPLVTVTLCWWPCRVQVGRSPVFFTNSVDRVGRFGFSNVLYILIPCLFSSIKYLKHIYIYIYIYIYTGCPRRNVPDFGRMFLKLKYTDITQNTYIQSWTVTEIMAREIWKYGSGYTLIDYQIHIKTGRNIWFL